MLSQRATDLLLRHPGLIIVETDDGVLLRGIIKNKQTYYHINISCPNFPKLQDFKMQMRHGFIVKEYTAKTAALDKFINLWTIDDLISNLEQLEQYNENDNAVFSEVNKENNNNNAEGVEKFYAEIAALHKPENYEIQMNSSSTLLRFCNFFANEQHYIEVELPSLHIRDHSLPDCIKVSNLLTKTESLTAIVEKYQKFIEDLQPFYENLIAIDELCHVLQPAKPTTKHNYRLFVLKERVFLKLTIGDPFAPLTSMSLQIIGPTSEVEALRRIYSEGLKDWNAELDIQNNLLRIFNLCFFPMPPEDKSDDQEQQQFCNICYSYRLESNENDDSCNVPVFSCDNPRCTLVFHDVCLFKWFRTLTDNVSFLNVPFGDCPFCKAKICTSFEELRSS